MIKKFAVIGVAVLLTAVLVSLPSRSAHGQENEPELQSNTSDFVAPIVFQAAGPSVASIQSTIAEFRIAVGDPNNGNSGPQNQGRREINWDGGSTTNVTTSLAPNPFNGFQTTRGALFTTPDGTGFVQAPPSGLASAAVFNNPSYATIFSPFSQSRLFAVIGGRITDVDFFVPGGGGIVASTKGFGAVFSDVDQPDGSGPGEKHGNRKSSTLIEYFDANGQLLFSSFVPAAPGNGGQSFLGIVFSDERIAKVRIISGNAVPGADDIGKQDVVVMDDFIYSEPKALQ